jgi:hypothetical protein
MIDAKTARRVAENKQQEDYERQQELLQKRIRVKANEAKVWLENNRESVFSEIEMMASRGFNALECNPRGATVRHLHPLLIDLLSPLGYKVSISDKSGDYEVILIEW